MNILFLSLIFFVASCKVSLQKPSGTPTSFDDGRNGKGPALAVIGDSLSTGVLASTVLGGDLPPGALEQLTKMVLSNDHDMENVQGLFSELQNSSTSTDQDWGLRASIAKNLKLQAKDMPLYFAAKWGGRSSHISTYLEHLRANYAVRRKPAEYVVLMIGGNDFCYGSTPEEFQVSIEKKFPEILKLHPDSTVIVALTPIFTDILRYNHQYGTVLSCEKFRIQYCKKIFDPTRSNVAAGYNEALMRIVNYYRHVYPGKILLSSEFESMYMEADDLSFDCFHLSLKGQKKFAKYYAHTLARSDY
jgi:lysophospholipase L1-like esterase